MQIKKYKELRLLPSRGKLMVLKYAELKNNYDFCNMRIWIHAARLRTLPLSLSGIFLGTLIAVSKGYFSWSVFVLACITTLFLQVLSNYTNDYADGIKGTDENRTGEMRAVAAGKVSAQQMKKAMYITGFLSLFFAVVLLMVAYLPQNIDLFLIYMLLGVACIWAAIQYTAGKNAYGYRGLGDVFVFIFFGLIAVVGTDMLYTHEFKLVSLLPASCIGLLSAAVLNLNNMRDLPQDKLAGKMTIPVKKGFSFAKKYHQILLFMPFVLGVIYMMLAHRPLYAYFFMVLLAPAQKLNLKVQNTQDHAQLDSELKKTAFLTLCFSVLFGLGLFL